MFRKTMAAILAVCMTGMIAFTGCGDTSDSSSSSSSSTEATNAPAAEAGENEATDAPKEAGENEATDAPREAGGNNASSSSADYSFHGEKFVVTLYKDKAPITCENFEKLVSEGFYDGLIFHRIVEGFMAQGGDPEGTGMGGSDETIKGEFSSNGVENDLSHKRGVISMARSMDPNSASSQFFICFEDSSFLDGNYAAFGEVTEGMETIDAFLEVPRSMGNDGDISAPNDPIVIDKAVMIDPDENGNPRAEFTMK
ncbi:MAG: peptidylprolyl isomerase [Ruminococcus sp.]|nr:peptidylprolyl isomerase [Ruminococcus sp.]